MAETKNMTVSVSFPGLDKKPAPIRSLANFIAENSSLYFRDKGSSDGLEIVDYYVNDSLWNNYDLLVLYIPSGDYENNTSVLVSGILTSSADSSVTLNVRETGFIERIYEVDDPTPRYTIQITLQDAESITHVKGDSWVGFEGLNATLLLNQPTDKSELISLANQNNIELYEYEYELIPGADSPNTYRITLDDSFSNIKCYASFLIVIPPPVDTYDPATILPITNAPFVTDNECGFSIPDTVSIESLIVSERPIIVTPEKESSLSGTVRFDNMLIPYSMFYNESNKPIFGYDISAKYASKSSSSRKPIAAHSESNEYVHGFTMEAARPGVDGNNLKVIFGQGSGSDLVMSIYNGEINPEDEDENLVFYYYLGINEGNKNYEDLNQIYTYYNDEPVYITNFVKFKYTSDDGSWLVDHEGYVYHPAIVINFTGGAEDGGTVELDTMTNYVLDCDTSLTKVSSDICVRELANTSNIGFGYYKEKSHVQYELVFDVETINDFIKLPISITPKIGNKVNTDSTVTPSSSLFNELNICSIPLASQSSLKYDIQLRTPTFTMCEYDSDSESYTHAYDVYYKVGVVPSDGTEKSRDKIIKNLRAQCLEFDFDPNYWLSSQMPPLSICLLSARWQDPAYSLLPVTHHNPKESYDDNWCAVYDLEHFGPEWIPSTMCIPLINRTTSKFEGLVYFKLCNSKDGTPFTSDISTPFYIVMKQSESEVINPPPYVYMYLSFTDEMLNGGFIKCNDIDPYYGDDTTW